MAFLHFKCAQKTCYKTYLLTIYYIFTFLYRKYLHKRKKLFNFVVYFAKWATLRVAKRVI